MMPDNRRNGDHPSALGVALRCRLHGSQCARAADKTVIGARELYQPDSILPSPANAIALDGLLPRAKGVQRLTRSSFQNRQDVSI